MFFDKNRLKALNGGLFRLSKFQKYALQKCRRLGLFWTCAVYIFTGALYADNYACHKN